jgi:multidrug efflux system membrane fusion protein
MRSSLYIALAVAVLAALWIGSGLFKKDEESPAANSVAEKSAQENDDALVDVRVRRIRAEAYEDHVTVTGRSHASRTVEIRAETQGRVKEILFEEGRLVEEGEVIMRLDLRDRKARVNEARELVAQREIEYNAARELETRGFNSRIRLSEASATLEAAKASLEMARVDLDQTEITAPFDGILNSQHSELGDYVTEGAVLYSIVDLDPLEFIGFVTERYIGGIQEGQRADAELLDGRTVTGTVTFVSPAANEDTRTFRVVASMPNEDMAMREGLTAALVLPLSERRVHRISPSVLTLDDLGRVGVRIVGDNDTVRFMPVTIVADSPGFMLVDGLPESVRLITVGQEFVIDGQTVNPVPSEGGGLL